MKYHIPAQIQNLVCSTEEALKHMFSRLQFTVQDRRMKWGGVCRQLRLLTEREILMNKKEIIEEENEKKAVFVCFLWCDRNQKLPLLSEKKMRW